MESRKIAVAMSGGVDSSVAAALLLESGADVIGVTMTVSSDAPAQDAKKVADYLGIRHYVLDLREEFRRLVVEPFAAAYSQGKTPNPCVICNAELKFGLLRDFARDLGYEYFATGHYLSLHRDENGIHVLPARDKEKDQAYMLYRLPQEVWDKLVFPLADYTKEEVQSLAVAKGIPILQEESQDICFLADKDNYADFLAAENLIQPVPGNIVDIEGTVLGTHKGVHNYTIGQRKGLGVALGEPVYVSKIDAEKREVVLAQEAEIMSTALLMGDANFIHPVDSELEVEVKIRYSMYSYPATIERCGDEYLITFKKAVRAVTPGQSAVVYSNGELLGGGIILSSYR